MLAGIRAYLPLFLSLTHLPDSLFFQSCLLHEAGIIASSMLTSFQIHQQRRKGLQSPLLDLIPMLCQWEKSQGRTLIGLTWVPYLRTGQSPGHSCVVGDGWGSRIWPPFPELHNRKKGWESPLMVLDMQLPEKMKMRMRKEKRKWEILSTRRSICGVTRESERENERFYLEEKFKEMWLDLQIINGHEFSVTEKSISEGGALSAQK